MNNRSNWKFRLSHLAAGAVLFAAVANLPAQVTLTTLHTFTWSNGDGAYPYAGLVQGSDGWFYGTTWRGGTNGEGTVFQINTNGGSYTVLHSFSSLSHAAYLTAAGLVEDRNDPGNFYGVTSGGGTNDAGTVFWIKPDGSYAILYSFGGSPDGNSDDTQIYASLVQGTDGNFYGTTPGGGTNDDGTVFQITPNGDETVLHSFIGSPDGDEPYAGLVQASDGNFYGTTSTGGTNTGNEYGTVFQLNITNGILTTLHTFVGGSHDGSDPEGALVQGLDGNLYGTTAAGGPGDHTDAGEGIVFRISPSGSYTNIHSFPAFSGDGVEPVAGLVLGSDGNFYGTTQGGGTPISNNGGTVFRISPTGTYSNLYSFTRGGDGGFPYGGLVQGSDGNFYGTTESDGTNGYGTVFKLVVPLNPPANQISSIQIAGTNALVTIPSVSGETYQLQYRDSLIAGGWTNVDGASARSIGGPLTLTHWGGASPAERFYRFAINP
jgi:uncharacterized repeat protein (TIGR03803 family)